MTSRTWVCRYCHSINVHSNSNYSVQDVRLFDSASGEQRFRIIDMVCGNKKCQRLGLQCAIGAPRNSQYADMGAIPTKVWNLLPSSSALALPEYIPASLRSDYEESNLIADLSPKASATLSRRCLQGMIRDRFGIAKHTLFQEIESIKDLVEPSVWEAIDAVRAIGNIGAHMEKDISVIVDVEPDEAKLLIELIEQLFREWYIARHERNERMNRVKSLAAKKKDEKTSNLPSED